MKIKEVCTRTPSDIILFKETEKYKNRDIGRLSIVSALRFGHDYEEEDLNLEVNLDNVIEKNLHNITDLLDIFNVRDSFYFEVASFYGDNIRKNTEKAFGYTCDVNSLISTYWKNKCNHMIWYIIYGVYPCCHSHTEWNNYASIYLTSPSNYTLRNRGGNPLMFSMLYLILTKNAELLLSVIRKLKEEDYHYFLEVLKKWLCISEEKRWMNIKQSFAQNAVNY